MPNGEQVLVESSGSSWQHKLCRAIMLKVFASLPQGQMVIKEKGVLVNTYGQKESDLHAEIDIQCLSVYQKLLFGGSVASGETFSEGLWTTPVEAST